MTVDSTPGRMTEDELLASVGKHGFLRLAALEEALAKRLDFEWDGNPDVAVTCRIRAKALRDIAEKLP